MIGSCQTVPVKYSLGASRVGREPARWMFIVFLLFEQEIPQGEESLLRRLELEGPILRDAAKTPLIPG
jgi:hypothetical protein